MPIEKIFPYVSWSGVESVVGEHDAAEHDHGDAKISAPRIDGIGKNSRLRAIAPAQARVGQDRAGR